MSDDVRQLEMKLEWATAVDPPGGPPDAEAAALRETWLAWTRLLERAEPSGWITPAPRRPANGRRQMWMAAAVAISISAVLATTGLVAPERESPTARDTGQVSGAPDGAPLTPPVSLAEDRDTRMGGAGRQARHVDGQELGGTASPPPFSDTGELAWDDSLDEQIASAGCEVLRVQRGWSRLDRPLDAMYQQLERIDTDMAEEAL